MYVWYEVMVCMNDMIWYWVMVCMNVWYGMVYNNGMGMAMGMVY